MSNDDIAKAECKAHAALDALRGVAQQVFDGQSLSEADWKFLAEQARALDSACSLRMGLLVIERTS